jgi:(E)-4-hydroxy-3-methylbut-2-enyl-diphosphate synthase
VRRLAARLDEAGLGVPLVLVDRPAARGADPLLGASAAVGALLCEGIGDSVQIEASDATVSRRLAFGILQGARVRMTRTEFISCPSCGRTLFDLETTTARVKARTAHLKGLKIAVMGCIVNGPGEMADADFGYVGWGDEKIALFVGRELVEKDIPIHEAEDRLVELIRRHGKWVEPPVSVPEEA